MRYKEKKNPCNPGMSAAIAKPEEGFVLREWGFVRFQSISVLACSDVSLLIVDLIIKSLA